MGDDHPPRRFRVVWGVSIGVVAALLLLVDGLQALQAASIAARAAGLCDPPGDDVRGTEVAHAGFFGGGRGLTRSNSRLRGRRAVEGYDADTERIEVAV